jgi:predicted SAM-dependent methyltransferase
VGCGNTTTSRDLYPDAELVRVDIRPEMEPDVVADVRDLPEGLGTFDVVFSRHVLEHLGRRDIVDTLKHWGSFLVDGGELHIAVPDLQWAVEQLWLAPATLPILFHIYGGQDYGPPSYHKWGFTAMLLRTCLQVAGFTVKGLVTQPYGLQVGDETVKARELYARH